VTQTVIQNACLAVLVLTLPHISAAEAAAPIKRLVLDDRIIAAADNAGLSLGTVVKHPDTLFSEDKPWEPRFDNVYPNVIYDADEKLYKCWYSPFIIDPSATNTPRSEREGRRMVWPGRTARPFRAEAV
jgi:hypothetical protein